ncbi:SgcJ/EcaC family oxidoreductase [Bradyrhizobium diazoefficiens]|nr:SgcJ/EcaC family oxidoreductase [Bradyrhizobium diazoefficiens]UCF55480.1 MAG: SgcJ/EcaC family oxidoreductase [Bradyrhizobium sp.]MBR0964515.1 SgcJ/EcaC family oxidoreductase [Bradyrhizobium diazoefficiens]MBR0978675.1 SgcJ/EcaC family oxidoreductase [Bradyrhizobium diazoefficiens]MBR1008225.1 SgcJ/EcaC family oxidoreductase [Bradyrhizobium diazoefficiens]MBR1013843.1 SgcJ/EcaC family oxidoreductase [Bradyrhizobium diazoefficiens]
MSSEADAIVSAIIAKWCAGFAALDAAALSSLYAQNAFFFGSNPRLYRGRDGVADYVNGLPRWRKPAAVFSEVQAAQAGPDLINMGATITFDLAGERPDLVVKMSWVIIREDGEWKIVNHHASAKAPLV